jgi:hypothetical protein
MRDWVAAATAVPVMCKLVYRQLYKNPHRDSFPSTKFRTSKSVNILKLDDGV